jgi:glutamate formiminotransferase
MPLLWIPEAKQPTCAMNIIECIPNFSEGRDSVTIRAILEAITGCGVAVVDHSADVDHHRMVVTFLGAPEAVMRAALAGAREAVRRIDLTRHHGQHPRIGAVDVIPLVPLVATPMDLCIRLSRELGSRLAEELGMPVYLYEESATQPERQNLALVRAGGFEALRGGRLVHERAPDFGPDRVHPTAGAVAVGARYPLIAFNVLLRSDDLEVARRIARSIRERDGGLRGVKALGLRLESRGCVQVAINITRPDEVPLYRVFELVKIEAARHGIAVSGSELIGAFRLTDALEVARHYLALHDLSPTQVLDPWLTGLQEVD